MFAKNTTEPKKPIALNATCKSYLLMNHFHRLICPSCAMFGAHKQHSVTEPTEAVRKLRDSFDASIKSGISPTEKSFVSIGKLKVESTETVLVDIRQALVQCDQSRNRILKEVDKVMTDLI